MIKRAFLKTSPTMASVVIGLTALTTMASAQDLLPPEQAFRVVSRQVSPEVVQFVYIIAPGYILYKDRFSVSVNGTPDAPTERLALVLPPPLTKVDRISAQTVEHYRDSVTVQVKLPSKNTASTVTATAQGCAVDIGVCYPPVTAIFTPVNVK